MGGWGVRWLGVVVVGDCVRISIWCVHVIND